MHEHVLPDQCAHCWHDEERSNDHQADDIAPDDRLIEEEGEERAANDADRQHCEDELQRIADGGEEGGIAQEILVVENADKALITRIEEIVAQKREIDGEAERYDHPQEEDDYRGGDGQFAEHSCLLRSHAKLPSIHISPSFSPSPARQRGRRSPK